ncbi:efflux RND transporter periplasmic adaptor subunit [Planctobacterium marinum]|uniref:efflux RND transporter periplasmic adaptor subunit n=1 Tax=Planctobacterium marinum TaxID=1631968 RepID=UPI001E558D51|nr:efflux RND transporter periplasmic adaptor subunit [Planctobacterium marinum]MCC2605025.1 efflux RND transporter periplasmic adaptor subunit [Planctobacterium marinum]
MSRLITRFRQQPVWIALIISLFLVLWIASGMVSGQTEGPVKEKQDALLQKVEVTTFVADNVNKEVSIYGRTEPDRMATLRAEVAAQVTEILASEGASVSAGQLLFRLDEKDLKQQVRSAQATVKQRELELQGAESLKQKGLQSEVTIAQSLANLESAKSQLIALQIMLQNTEVKAPYAGVLNTHAVEVGDYVKVGDPLATLVDLDPLVIRADVTENDIAALRKGQSAQARLVSGRQVSGQVRYIASVSNEGTNTFKIEVAVPNPEGQYLAGMSTQLVIPLEETLAVRVTPAVMSLDERGELGVKTVDADDTVHFVPINMVKSDNEGVWLSGLGHQADIITLGQGFVRDGDKVEVVRASDIVQVK